MKKTIFLLVAFVSTTMLFSQKLTAAKVPVLVKESFQKAHPNARSSWEWEGAAYEANFKEAGKAMSCVINSQGTILETESSVAINDLPSAARSYVQQHYKSKRIKEVAKIAKANGDINYEVNVQGRGDVLFDNNGNRIAKQKEKH